MMRPFWLISLALMFLGLLSNAAMAADGDAVGKKIVLIAGKKSHPAGMHEYELDVKLLKACFDTSPNLKSVVTETHFDGWPLAPTTLDNADTIVLFSDGLDKPCPIEQHPFLKGDHLTVIERQIQRGCGLAMIHWPLWVPGKVGSEKFQPWLGGFCDYETPPGPGMSDNVDWSKQAVHPVCRGLKPFTFDDEYYANARFLAADERFAPVLPFPGKPKDRVWAWAWNRSDGGRSFAFIGGHTHANWKIDDLRKAVLNAIAWTARIKVPSDGVQSNILPDVK